MLTAKTSKRLQMLKHNCKRLPMLLNTIKRLLCATVHGTMFATASCASCALGMRNCAFLRVKITLCLFFKLDRWKKLNFLLLNPKLSYGINRDPCTHSYSFRKLMVQGLESKVEGLHAHLVVLVNP